MLGRVAQVSFGSSPTTIRRKEGQRALTITANVDPAVVTGQVASRELQEVIIPSIAAENTRLTVEFGGEQQQQADSFSSIGIGFVLALLVIYALLAIPFGSYVQPLIVMAAIPFGIVGALWAHFAMDLPLGLISVFGIIGLSGVVVNDALVMIDFINEERRNGMNAREAIIKGAKVRFRPIMLTSLTTFLGVAPARLRARFAGAVPDPDGGISRFRDFVRNGDSDAVSAFPGDGSSERGGVVGGAGCQAAPHVSDRTRGHRRLTPPGHGLAVNPWTFAARGPGGFATIGTDSPGARLAVYSSQTGYTELPIRGRTPIQAVNKSHPPLPGPCENPARSFTASIISLKALSSS